MSSCNVDHSDYRNNGLITKIWGGAGWIFTHSITFGYPIDPTEQQKKDYKDFFILLGKVLPCRFCRESYEIFITTGETALTDEVLTNRETLTKWYYKIHEAVNNKLGIDYGITYKDVVNRYESFRARCNMTTDPLIKGCVTPLDYKTFSYRKLNQLDCPIIRFELLEPFLRLAKLRGLDNRYFKFLEIVHDFEGNYKKLKKQDVWMARNKFCEKQIKYMRESGIPAIEEHGEWKGTPTMDELKLIMFLCSTLNKTEIRDCLKAMMHYPKYMLSIESYSNN